jgi:predicted DNA-binding protein (MmcQ/YjbR family)
LGNLGTKGYFATFYGFRRLHCLAKPYVTESFPFDEHTLVFKVQDKIFALIALEKIPAVLNLKCDPQKAQQLREQYPAIIPGYHANKKHWNSILLDNSLSLSFILELINHSYELVVSKVSAKKTKEILGE